MIQRILWFLGAAAWGGLTFLIGLYVTFPSTVAKDRLVYEFGEATNDDYALGVGGLSLWRLSGVDLDDVTLYKVVKGRRGKGEAKSKGERAEVLHLDGLGVRAAPLSMLMGKKAAAFAASVYGGAIDGEYATAQDLVELSFDAGDVDLSQLPFEKPEMSLKLKGILAGEADLSFDTDDVKKSTGSLKLSFDGLGLGPDSMMGGFQLPEVNFSRAAVSFEVKEGKLEVTEGDFTSDSLEATLSGDIVLNKKLTRSRNRLELVFSLPEDIDKLAQIAPDLKRARDDEGKYHLNIGGTVLSPSVRFSRSGASRSKDGDGPTGALGGRPFAGGGDFSPGQSDEERREAREARIKERRERLRKRREEAAENGGGGPGNSQARGDKGDDGMGPEDGEFDPADDGPRGEGNGPENMTGPFLPEPPYEGPPLEPSPGGEEPEPDPQE
jgi:type II secretion system protein N